ncbi:hypothetical protein PAXRUDRAFT_19515 [Paxillus rubicundulus Ve08.2h10]|uniref:Uncharacterized protein n=1 Tax=Paxillus rubicundulus Ve08.2h10 TaxID=930991 RepID=A0A0D0CHY8_9AGAM|nr:hypothetical protein PAXRUDRAFT_19515 [Paxillus rubicundulus Ve08.2h10]
MSSHQQPYSALDQSQRYYASRADSPAPRPPPRPNDCTQQGQSWPSTQMTCDQSNYAQPSQFDDLVGIQLPVHDVAVCTPALHTHEPPLTHPFRIYIRMIPLAIMVTQYPPPRQDGT